MFRWTLAILTLALGIGFVAAAEDKKIEEKKADVKLSGTWEKEFDGGKISMDFTKKDEVLVKVIHGDDSLAIKAKLTIEKDGTIKCKSTKNEGTGAFKDAVKDDYEFSFKIKIDEKKKATISDYTANDKEEQGKPIVEGDYKPKEDK